jgi:hypothetical protein
MKNVVCLLLYLLLTGFGSLVSRGQERKIHFGPSISGGIKYPFIGNGSRNYHLFGEAGFGLAAKLSGSTEEALSFLARLSVMRENTGYHHVSSEKYSIETINVVFNPEVLIPSRHQRWAFTAGIGIDWMADLGLAEYNKSGHPSYPNLDAISDTINAARRPLIPFVSVGLLYHLHRGLYAQLALRQDLLDAYPDNTTVTFGSRNPLTVSLSHQPTRLGLGIFYLF